jgi:hypothetical protein
MIDHEVMESVERIKDAFEQREARLESALKTMQEVARMMARDSLRIAELLPPGDLLEAEEVAGVVERAHKVLGPDARERH